MISLFQIWNQDRSDQGFLNCAAPLRLGVSALGICFDSYPKKILSILYLEFFLDFFYSSKITQFLHVKWVAVTPRTLEIAFFWS